MVELPRSHHGHKVILRFISPKLPALLILSCAALAGCGSPSNNPNFFTVDYDDGKMTGRFNPAGFTADEVKKLLASDCVSGKLASFGTQPVDTMMAFTATCQGPARVTAGNAEIERAEGGKVVVETTTSDSRGNMVYDQTAVTL